MAALFNHWSGRFPGLSGLCRRAATSIEKSSWVCYTLHYLLCDYAIYLMYVGLGYLATICLRYVLFVLVLRKSLRKGLRESLRPRFIHASRRLYAMTAHSSFTATRYSSLHDCKTRSAKLDSLPAGCVYSIDYWDIVVWTLMMFVCVAERPCYYSCEDPHQKEIGRGRLTD